MEVTYADQQQINTFNKLNQRYRELAAESKAKKASLACALLELLRILPRKEQIDGINGSEMTRDFYRIFWKIWRMHPTS